MNNIIYDDNIITPENDKWDYYYDFTKKLNERNCVKLALFCAKIANPNTKESNHCIELVEKWLLDENSVSKKELCAVAYAAYSTAAYVAYSASTAAAYSSAYSTDAAKAHAVYAADAAVNTASCNITITNDINLYLKTLLRTTKQYNTTNHNNQHYEFILKEIINEDIDKLTDTDYNMLTDISQEYYNINPNITNKNIFVELLRKEYE